MPTSPCEDRSEKIKRNGPMTLELEPTPDILAELGATQGSRSSSALPRKPRRAGERAQEAGQQMARRDRAQRRVAPGIGFDSERNAVTIITPAGAETVPETTKLEVAQRVLDAVAMRGALRSFPAACSRPRSLKTDLHAPAPRSADQSIAAPVKYQEMGIHDFYAAR